MTIEEAIRDIEECVIPYVGGISLRMAVEALKEQRPRGKWIKFTLEGGFLSSHKCSKCGFNGNQLWHFCPSCGADMREEGDSDG